MKNFRFIPRLEIKSNKLIKGMRMEGLREIGDPVEYAKYYVDNGADEIIIDDIVASLYSRPFDHKLIKDISKNTFIPLTASGGIRDIYDIHNLLDSGADKVCINTSAMLNPDFIYEASRIFGSQCITISVQAKNIFENHWEPFTESGRNRMHIDLFEWLKKVQDLGAGEIFLISIDRDGVKAGIQRGLIKEAKQYCEVPLLIGGGISGFKDINFLIEENLDGCVMSQTLHFKDNDILSLKTACKSNIVDIRL
jgi:imidazole glycerol-phosphate synthase subunit HisF